MAATVALVGCTLTPPVEVAPGRSERLQRIEAWYAAGRFSLRGPSETLSGRFEWRRSPGRDDLLLSDPVGRGVARATVVGDRARVVMADGRITEGTDLGNLLTDFTGVPVPLSRMRYWLLGVPAPTQRAQEVSGDSGLPESIRQTGWTLRYSRYREVGKTGALVPERVRAEAGDVSLRLVINRWRLDG